jgi:hypothetical protein
MKGERTARELWGGERNLHICDASTAMLEANDWINLNQLL